MILLHTTKSHDSEDLHASSGAVALLSTGSLIPKSDDAHVYDDLVMEDEADGGTGA